MSGGTAKPADTEAPLSGAVAITLRINGADREVLVEPRTTLLDAIRERPHLSGTKKGCDHGQCGCCTVLVDGTCIMSCLTLMLMHARDGGEGDETTTFEGLASGGDLHPMQAAFVAHDGYQCGYCTPGQIMSAVRLVGDGMADDRSSIAMGMAGNLCRCSAYANIVQAIDGLSRGHALLGGSPHCFASHASSLAAALLLYDAMILTQGSAGKRRFPILELHREPGDTPEIEHGLEHGKMITHVEPPQRPWFANAASAKVRDRFLYSNVQVCAALDLDGRHVRDARLMLASRASTDR